MLKIKHHFCLKLANFFIGAWRYYQSQANWPWRGWGVSNRAILASFFRHHRSFCFELLKCERVKLFPRHFWSQKRSAFSDIVVEPPSLSRTPSECGFDRIRQKTAAFWCRKKSNLDRKMAVVLNNTFDAVWRDRNPPNFSVKMSIRLLPLFATLKYIQKLIIWNKGPRYSHVAIEVIYHEKQTILHTSDLKLYFYFVKKYVNCLEGCEIKSQTYTFVSVIICICFRLLVDDNFAWNRLYTSRLCASVTYDATILRNQPFCIATICELAAAIKSNTFGSKEYHPIAIYKNVIRVSMEMVSCENFFQEEKML